MKKRSNKQAFSLKTPSGRSLEAFSLVEIIVAFSVLVLVIFASTNLLVSIIRSNSENVNTLTAYGLAQEGLEAMRNIRDSNWLLGADFQGKVGANCLWPGDVCLPGSIGDTRVFALKFNEVQSLGFGTVSSDQIQNYAPWELKEVSSSPTDPVFVQETQLYKSTSEETDVVWYQPCFSPCTLDPSLFLRFIEVEPFPYATDATKVKKYRVSSVVRWQEIGRQKEVRLTTELTDWKGGPL